MKLSAIDTNLLLALQALLQETSVTRAAKRLGIGQPAMSRSLARLRDHFEDPLLVQKGRQLVLSATARALLPTVEKAAAAIAEVFGDERAPGRPSAGRTSSPAPTSSARSSSHDCWGRRSAPIWRCGRSPDAAPSKSSTTGRTSSSAHSRMSRLS